MKITKHEHACLTVENDGQFLVIDPGVYSDSFVAMPNTDAVVVTHEHGDHFDSEKIAKISSLNPDVVIYTTQKVAEQFHGANVPPVDEPIAVGNFTLQFFGHDHAPIVDGVVPCDNFGVIVNDALAYPGDSFELPPITPQILALPASAPWLKIDEALKYLTAVKPAQVFPTHNALLSEIGRKITYAWLQNASEKINAEFIDLQPGDSFEA